MWFHQNRRTEVGNPYTSSVAMLKPNHSISNNPINPWQPTRPLPPRGCLCEELKMSSLSLASIFAGGCRSFGAPVTALRTLASTHTYLFNKHQNNNSLAWFSLSSRKGTFSYASSGAEVTCTTTSSSANG